MNHTLNNPIYISETAMKVRSWFPYFWISLAILTLVSVTVTAIAAPLVLNSTQIEVEPLEVVVLPDINGDGVFELGVASEWSDANKVNFHVVDGANLNIIQIISWNDIYENPSFHVLPDLNGNGTSEIAVFGTRDDAGNEGKAQLFARDLVTGANARVFNWPSNWQSAEALILDDLNGDGLVDVAIQGRFKEGDRPQLVVRNGADSKSIGTFGYPDLFNNPKFYQHSDVDGDGTPEISTLGRIKRNNKIQVKITDGSNSNNRLKAYNFPDKWSDIEWIRLDDHNNDGIDDWGLFGKNKEDNRSQLIVKDGKNPRGAIRIFAWSGDIIDPEFFQIPDMNGDGIDEVAVGGIRTNGRYQFQVKDGTNRNISLANHNLKLNLTNISAHVMSDLTGDGIVEIGFLGLSAQGQYNLVVRNGDGSPGTDGDVIQYMFSNAWSAKPSISVFNDVNGDNLQELLVTGQFGPNSTMELWGIPDSDQDSYADTLDAFPSDINEWLDTDKDGEGNNADTDDDGDGLNDDEDGFPLISISGFIDTDNDGIPDDCNSQCQQLGMTADEDDDGNGIPDIDEEPPEILIAIESPDSLLTVGTTPIAVTGTVSPENASLIINGVAVQAENGNFSVDVALEEGLNTIEARATLRETVKTDTITVSLDQTPPSLTIDSHSDGQKVFSPEIILTGLINDVVRGAIGDDKANVTVNGTVAEVENRSYAAEIELIEGSNTIEVVGTDKVGNLNTTQIELVYEITDGRTIQVASGQSQSGEIGEVLSEDLVVTVVDENQLALQNVDVVFRVSQGDGSLLDNNDKKARAALVKTDANGQASSIFKLGTRVGQKNQKVTARVVGINASVVFAASAESAMASKITVNVGSNQRGSVGQRLPSPFVVYVTDDGANPVSGASVNFKVISGGGSFKEGKQDLTVTTTNDGFASAEFWLGETLGVDAQRVVAMLESSSDEGLTSEFSATAYQPADAGSTSISGLVLDTQANPLQGVTVLIEDSTRQAVTDDTGYFNISEAPVGAIHLLVDGSTIENADGDYPTLAFNPVLVAGIANTLQQPIYMVKLSDTNKDNVSEIKDAVVTMDDFPGYKLEIAANSATFPDGSKSGIVSISAVNSNRVPMAPPNGMQPQLAVTIQPSGTLFDPPAKITIPNLDGMEPGRQIDMYSFDHDLNEFVSIGLGTVSEDGSLIESNPGVGVIKAGWYIVPQPPEGDGDVEGDPDLDGEPPIEPPVECGRFDFICKVKQAAQNVADKAKEIFDDATSCDEGEICDYIKDSAQDFAESVGDAVDDLKDRVADGVDDLINAGTELANEAFDKLGEVSDFVQDQAQRALDPIIVATGELEFSQTDLRIPGRGFDFELKRTYRSRLHFNGRVGYNWVFNYYQLLDIPQAGEPNQNIVRSMENGLQYTYVANQDGSYSSPNSIFDILRKNSDGTFTVRRSDGFKTNFDADGRMVSQLDRYGNTMSFQYDDAERLVLVVDTLGREIVFSYRSDSGHIETVTDFSGRSVRYYYNQDRDLIAARTPVVTGTPNSNDFVNGKFTQYTYSSGFDENDETLKHANHNLLTVTDAQGNVYLRNVYVNDPESYQFDKITEQQYGEESQIFTVTYEELNAGEALTANLPRNLTTVIDRNDNLIEYTHNYGGMLLEERHFTNRDVSEDDPDVFITRHEYNLDGLLLSKTLPAGNTISYVYDSSNSLRNMQRNLLSSTVTPGARGATQATLTEQFTYEPIYTLVASTTNRRGFTTTYSFDYQHEDNLVALANELNITSVQVESLLSEQGIVLEGGVVGQITGNVVQENRPTATLVNGEEQVVTLERSYNRFGQLVEEIDAEGLVTQIEYYPENDPDGDGTQTDSTRTLASSDGGYKKSIKLDARTTDKRSRSGNALQITSSYAYDQVGNIISETDARGNTTRFIRNQLNQVVRKIAPEPFEYLTDYYYDANNNLVRVSQQNIGTNSVALSGWVHTIYGYDSLNDKISETQIPEEDVYLTTSYEYDGNQNLVAIQQPEGNRVERVYDERDLVYTLSRGAGTDDSSTRIFSYDANGNLTRQLDAQDNTGDGNNDATLFTYDGYDRLIQSVDAEDNRKTYQYDANNNIVVERHYGNSGIAGIDNQILLSENTTSYDELDRAWQRDDSLLVNGLAKNVDAGQTPDDNKVTVTHLYDANNQVLAVTDDNGNSTEYVYDGLNRSVNATDANGNITISQYDANSNVLQVSVVQVNVDDLVETKTIQSVATYDELNRRVTSADALNNTTEYRYDARNNLVLVTDPLGNLTLSIYDGLNRLIQTREYLAEAGNGASSLDTANPANPDGIISTFYGYDSNSRLVFLADDKGNPTTYSFDALNRQTQITYADETTNTFVYDKDDNLISVTDQNGSVLNHDYDGLNRLVATNATKASGVIGSTLWTYSYDGLSRRILATDNNDPAIDSDDSQVEYSYNSFNHLLSETNKGLTTTATYDGLGNQQTLNYPGGRSLQNTFDNVYNLKSIKDADADANLVEYDYADSRVLNRRYANGTQLSYVTDTADSGYDAINRVLTHRHVNSEGALLSGFEYAYDKANNRRYEVDQFSQLADVYEYDSSYRLIRAAYQIDAANDNLQLVVNNNNTNEDVAPIIADEDESYMLDGVGNWVSVQTQMGSDSDAVGYQLNEMNEYTRVGANDQAHDNNGNLTNDGSRQYLFDAKNRLVRVTTLGGNTIASYKYDAFGRRIVKRAGAQTINYIHFGKQVIEERNAFSQMLRQYVYGNSVDEVIQLRNAANEDYFYHDNSIGSITAISDESGQVVERYRYNAYGNTTILSADGSTELTASNIGNTYAYTGRRLDTETGLYYYRARYYSPEQGRFIQRDPLGYADGMGVYTYVGNNPINYVDPDGLAAKEAWSENVRDPYNKWVDDHYNRNENQPTPPRNLDSLREREDYSDFDNYGETPTHNLGDTKGNQDYRNSKTGEQYIYDRDGNLDNTPLNGGSYDRTSPGEDVTQHFVDDVIPWIWLGNSPDDPSTRSERAGALGETFVNGVKDKANQAIDNIVDSVNGTFEQVFGK